MGPVNQLEYKLRIRFIDLFQAFPYGRRPPSAQGFRRWFVPQSVDPDDNIGHRLSKHVGCHWLAAYIALV